MSARSRQLAVGTVAVSSSITRTLYQVPAGKTAIVKYLNGYNLASGSVGFVWVVLSSALTEVARLHQSPATGVAVGVVDLVDCREGIILEATQWLGFRAIPGTGVTGNVSYLASGAVLSTV